MKKGLSLILVFILVFSMAACQNTANGATTQETESQTETTDDIDNNDEGNLTTLPAETEETVEETEAKITATPGTFVGNTYNNTTLNVTFEIPSDWTIDQGKDYNDIAYEEFTATSADQRIVLMLLREDLDGNEAAALTEKEYLEVIKADLITNSTYTLTDDYSTTEIAGSTYGLMRFTAVETNVTKIQTYYSYKVGSYMYTWILTSSKANKIKSQEVIDSISPLFDTDQVTGE